MEPLLGESNEDQQPKEKDPAKTQCIVGGSRLSNGLPVQRLAYIQLKPILCTILDISINIVSLLPSGYGVESLGKGQLFRGRRREERAVR